jgi:beta-glucosidase-like glycosyl hydrolase
LDLVHAILERLPVTQIDGVDDYQLQQLKSFEMTTVLSLLKVQPTVEVAATQEIASVNSCRCEETAAKIAEMAERMQRIEEMFGHLIVKFNDLGDTAVPLSDEVSLVTENVSQLRLQNDQPVYPANLEEEKMVSRSSRVDSHSSECAEHTSWATNGTQHEDSNMVLYQNSSPRRKASRGSSAETQQDSQWFKGHDRGEGIDNGERAAEGLSYEDTVMMPAGGGDELHEVRKKLARQYRQSQRKADKLMK